MEIQEQPDNTVYGPDGYAQSGGYNSYLGLGNPTQPVETVATPTTGASETQGVQGPQRPKRGLSRRAVLGISAGVGAAAIVGGGLEMVNLWQHGDLNFLLHQPIDSSMQTGHLLRRAGFGASPTDLANWRQYSFQDAVDRLINYRQVSDDTMENRLNALHLNMSGKGTIQNVQRWWLLRMAWTQRPLLEKMTLFWHGMLTSSFRKAGGASASQLMLRQNQFLRSHAFDTFDNILLGITADPAMLYYLDLTKSHKNAPNENYARELMELFTLGVGHYTQRDVSEGAAALTGWHARAIDATSHYNVNDHNNLTKTYLGHTGNLDYKDVISILTNHPAAPWFLSRKLFTFFVYENPSDSDVQPLVDTYVKSGHNVGEMMKTLLLSPQFSSPKAYRARLKSPTEFVVGAYRALDIRGDGYNMPLATTATGQALLDPPNVAGWPGDKVSATWLNSGTWMTRLNYIDQLLLGSHTTKGSNAAVDIQGIVKANNISTPSQFVDYFSSFLLDSTLDSSRRTQFINYFQTPVQSRREASITLTNGSRYSLSNARGTLYLILASPEYQLN
ncbi:MAG TPA: hypothetical protein DHW02_15205 [Ktedonobacter sp.]|nr:hypothetical protein [Ktedonobacter sp.]